MSIINFFILGSCVTRDIFRFVKDTYKITEYYSRTSVCSIISNPVLISENQIKLQSDFQRRMVIRDFIKTFFIDINNLAFDFLIIDLIDERFNLLKINGSVITRSVEFINAGLDYLAYEKIEKTLSFWEDACELFVKKLLSILPKEKIIIHEAYWANRYIDNGIIKEYKNQKEIDTNNDLLKRYYNILEKELSQKVVKTKNILMGDPNHIWGLTPFHYTEEYYKEIYSQIKNYKSEDKDDKE